MSPSINLRPRVSYPRQARAGGKYVISVDLDHAVPPDDWPYEHEEYPVTCFLDSAPYFTPHAAGDPTIVVHRFGGTYGPARFWVTAGKPGAATIRLTLVNSAGIPVMIRRLDDIRIVETAAPLVTEVTDAGTVPRSAREKANSGLREGVFRWLHLGDLHFRDARVRWPDTAEDVAQVAGAGPIDAVIVTGDLSYAGRAKEFQGAQGVLFEIRKRLAAGAQGSWPPLLVVPGNHDADRKAITKTAFDPTRWMKDPEARRRFWSDAASPARIAVDRLFATYDRWRRTAETAGGNVRGLLPGDFAVSLRIRGLRVGIVGLNDSFLVSARNEQMSDLDQAQLRAVCGDLEPWAAAHDLRILLTHHAPASLHAETRARFYEGLAPRWLFDVRLYGATHRQREPMEVSSTASGASVGCNAIQCYGRTAQGYRIGEARMSRAGLTVRVWSRVEKRNRFVSDPDVKSDRDGSVAIDAGQRGTRAAMVYSEPAAHPSVEVSGEDFDILPKVLASRAPVAQRHALVIGIDRYREIKPRLRQSAKDARLLGSALKRLGYRTFELLNREASSQAIVGSLQRMCEESGPNDLLVVFFSGYDIQDNNGRVMLLASDFRNPIDALPLDRVLDLARQHGRWLLLLGETLRARRPLAGLAPIVRWHDTTPALKHGVAMIWSDSTGSEGSSASRSFQRGTLADAVLRILEGASRSPLTVQVLADAVQENLNRQREAKGGLEQRPVVRIDPSIADLVVAEPQPDAVPRPEAAARSRPGPTGYDPAFLEGLEVPLPRLNRIMTADAATVAQGKGTPLLFHYEHFTVVMSGRRRLAYYAAVNVDVERRVEIPRSRDRWVYDERIGSEHQLGPDFYEGSPFDRSRLVKRLQAAWGKPSVGSRAAEQTNTFTNVVPLLSAVNQDRVWVELPDTIARMRARDGRMVMFAGPVFEDDDPVYSGIQVPRTYWRIAACVQENGPPVSMAFVVTQLEAGDEPESLMPKRAAGKPRRERPKIYQVRVADVEKLTGLSFGELTRIDEAAHLRSGMAWPIGSLRDVDGGAAPVSRLTQMFPALRAAHARSDADANAPMKLDLPASVDVEVASENHPVFLTIGASGDTGGLEFSVSSRDKQGSWRMPRNELALLDELSARARQIQHDERLGRTLFQLIVPDELRPALASASLLQLMVDEVAAHHPWEMLHDPKYQLPFALRCPVIRALRQTEPPPLRPSSELRAERALVIGPSELGPQFPPWPGAVAEVDDVAKRLTVAGVEVTRLTRPNARDVIGELYEQPYDVLHIVTHEAQGTYKSGIVIGDNVFLSAVEIRTLEAVPGLVVLNVCGSGYTAFAPRGSSEVLEPSLVSSLIRAGSRVVIAPWAPVSDRAAASFTNRFYEEILGGQLVPDAVLAARRQVFQDFPESSSWASYQCYCDIDARVRFSATDSKE